MFRNLNPAALAVSGRESEIIELCLSYGFKGLDLDLVGFQQNAKTHGLPHARRLLDSARLKFGTFRLPLVWDDDDATYKAGLEEMRDLISVARDLGVKRAITTVAPANDLRPYHENFEFHRRRLAEVGDVLEQHGMKLGIEFRSEPKLREGRAFQFVHTLDAVVMLVGMIRNANVGIVADLFEIYAAGGSFDEVRKLGGEKIVAVIASDVAAGKSPAECSGDDRLLPGETGVIELPVILTALAEVGYDGPLTPAASPTALKGLKRDQIVRTAGERLQAAWTAAGLNAAGKIVPAMAKK
jgi:sugar phosphate isomerase/epimerase